MNSQPDSPRTNSVTKEGEGRGREREGEREREREREREKEREGGRERERETERERAMLQRILDMFTCKYTCLCTLTYLARKRERLERGRERD